MLKDFLHWSPRILSVLFVGFLWLFSFDGFAGIGSWQAIAAYAVHLIVPAAVLLGTVIAWKRDLVGTMIFFFFAGYYAYMVGLDRHWSWYASISGPAVLIGVLYLLNWLQNKKNR